MEGVGQPNTQRSKIVGFLSAEGQQVPLWGFRDPCQLKAPLFLQATYPVILPPGPLEPRFQQNHVVPNTWGEHGWGVGWVAWRLGEAPWGLFKKESLTCPRYLNIGPGEAL